MTAQIEVILTRSWWFGSKDKGKHCTLVQGRTSGKSNTNFHAPFKMPDKNDALLVGTRKEINICARREGKRRDGMAQLNGLFGNVPPIPGCLCLADKHPPSQGFRFPHGRDLQGLRVQPRDQKILQVPGDKPKLMQRRVTPNSRICGEAIASFRLEKMSNMITSTH